MITPPDRCYEQRDHRAKTMVCEEKGRRVIFTKQTGQRADKIRVDRCCLPATEEACDYLVRDWANRQHFVELKGGHDGKALRQMLNTIPHFIAEGSAEKFWCLIATTGCTPRSQPGVQAKKREITRKWKKAEIVIRTGEYTHPLK
jgi:hypothetical protein